MFHKSLTKAYICATLILIVCLLPGGALPNLHVEMVSFDKLVHLVMYIPMTWTLAYGFQLQTRLPSFQHKSLLYAFLISCFYGAFIELLQWSLTPDRVAELYDFFADAAGAAIGILTLKYGIKLIVFWNKSFQKIASLWDVKDY